MDKDNNNQAIYAEAGRGCKMSRKLYLECNSGISGDMTVAALLDVGADEDVLRKALESIPLKGFKIEISRVKKAGIDCCDFNVILEHENHDHDMEYLHGHDYSENALALTHVHEHSAHHHASESACHTTNHNEPESACHTTNHNEPESACHVTKQNAPEHASTHVHHHSHRGLREIIEILEKTEMTENARRLSLKIFDILAEAESKAHACPKEEVHFHEVGAVDSIVDIAAIGICIDNLGIDEVIVPKVCEGCGTVRCQHGILSVPVPAVANIVAKSKITLEITNTKGELVTPTGAAAIAALMTSDSLPKTFKIEKIGLGAGKRTYERPSILRAMIINSDDTLALDSDSIYKLESDIDDCSGEILGYVLEQLFKAGARDVHYTPVFMKKNRPAWQLNVLCTEDKINELEAIIFKETTTIGIRRLKYERDILPREIKTVSTILGEGQVKVCRLGDITKAYPEYDSVVKLCKSTGKSFDEAYRELKREAEGGK